MNDHLNNGYCPFKKQNPTNLGFWKSWLTITSPRAVVTQLFQNPDLPNYAALILENDTDFSCKSLEKLVPILVVTQLPPFFFFFMVELPFKNASTTDHGTNDYCAYYFSLDV